MPTWTTADEIAYVKSIGSHAKKDVPHTKRQAIARTIELLKNYIAVADHRDWGEMDKKSIVAAAELRLKTLEMQKTKQGDKWI